MADPNAILPLWTDGWAWKALTGVLSVLGVDTMRRARKLELTSKTTAAAAADRAEIKQELTNLTERMESHRVEQKNDTQRLTDRMDIQHANLLNRIDTLGTAVLDRLGRP